MVNPKSVRKGDRVFIAHPGFLYIANGEIVESTVTGVEGNNIHIDDQGKAVARGGWPSKNVFKRKREAEKAMQGFAVEEIIASAAKICSLNGIIQRYG